jgi:hypothetical protein
MYLCFKSPSRLRRIAKSFVVPPLGGGDVEKPPKGGTTNACKTYFAGHHHFLHFPIFDIALPLHVNRFVALSQLEKFFKNFP